MAKYDTNLASEFYVLAVLYRLGADAALSLGNKKAVDITVVRAPDDVATVDVKGVAGKHDWPADNIDMEPKTGHFVVLVSFEGKIGEPKETPSVWVVPHAEIDQFRKQYEGRANISRAALIANGDGYRDNWELLLRRKSATPC